MNNETKQFLIKLCEQHGYTEEQLSLDLRKGVHHNPVVKIGDYCLDGDGVIEVVKELAEALNL